MFPILEVVRFIKKYNQSARIIVGGPFINTNVRIQDKLTLQYIFETINADYFVNSSQGEEALIKIIGALKSGLPVENINNIYYRSKDSYQATPVFPENNPLNENMVDWSLFAERVESQVLMRTAISCPFSCAFCGFPKHAGKYQTADIKAIEQELNLLDKIAKIKSVYFLDDTFNVPPDRFKEILKMLISNNYHFQ